MIAGGTAAFAGTSCRGHEAFDLLNRDWKLQFCLKDQSEMRIY